MAPNRVPSLRCDHIHGGALHNLSFGREAYHHSLQFPQLSHHQYPREHPYNRHGSGGGAVGICKLLSNMCWVTADCKLACPCAVSRGRAQATFEKS